MTSTASGCDVDGPVATVTLCRPDVLNAQTPAMWAELARHSRRELPGDVRVVVVRGEGAPSPPASTCRWRAPPTGGFVARRAGAAVSARSAQIGSPGSRRRSPGCADPILVTIAAVQGHAIGAGFQLALACDLRVLADDAQFSMAEVTLGLVPDLGGTKRLVELVGTPGRWRSA